MQELHHLLLAAVKCAINGSSPPLSVTGHDLYQDVALHSPLAAYEHCLGTTRDTTVVLREGWQIHAFKAAESSHLMYLARKRLWKSLLMVSLMKRFCALGSPRDWLRNTTSSSHRLLTCTACQASGVVTSAWADQGMRLPCNLLFEKHLEDILTLCQLLISTQQVPLNIQQRVSSMSAAQGEDSGWQQAY